MTAVGSVASTPGTGSAGLRAVASSATLVFASTLAWQLAGFLFNAVGAHALGPSKYGVLAASVGLLALVTPVMTAVQAVSSRETTSVLASAGPRAVASATRHYGWRVLAASAVGGAAVCAASSGIASLFRLGSVLPVILVGISVPLYVPSHFLSGVLQGSEQFGRFALETVIEATAKMVLAVALMAFVWQVPSAGLLAIVLSAGCGLTVNAVLVRGYLPRIGHDSVAVELPKAPVRDAVATLATFVLLAILLSVDTLVAKHYLPAHEAGLYAGVSLTGKIVFFATSALGVLVFPIFSRHHDVGADSRRWLVLALATAGVIIAAVVAVLALAPSLVVRVLLGSSYESVDGYVAWMGAAFGIYAIAYVLATYLLAQRRRVLTVALFVAVLVQLAGYFAFHSSIAQFIGVAAAAYTVAAVFTFALILVGGQGTKWRNPTDELAKGAAAAQG